MTVVVIGDNTGDDYSGTEDAELRQTSPTTNHGSSTNLEATKYIASDHNHSLVAFSGIGSLPSSLTVSSAVLTLYLKLANSGTHTLTVKRVLRNWVEAQATWNIWSTGNSWTTAGCLSDGNDRDSNASTTLSIGTTYQYYTFSDDAQIQADVEDFADGTLSNYGWHIERTDGTPDDTTYRQFSSSEDTDGQRPYLSVTYTTGGATTSPWYYYAQH